MLHVAVVEDETEYRGLIQEMVGRYAKEYDLQIQTTAFQNGREMVKKPALCTESIFRIFF